MRRDFDYVTMDDYKADTAELVTQSTAAITTLTRERADLMNVIYALVLAAGGQIEVPRHLRYSMDDTVFERWVDEANDLEIYRVRRGVSDKRS